MALCALLKDSNVLLPIKLEAEIAKEIEKTRSDLVRVIYASDRSVIGEYLVSRLSKTARETKKIPKITAGYLSLEEECTDLTDEEAAEKICSHFNGINKWEMLEDLCDFYDEKLSKKPQKISVKTEVERLQGRWQQLRNRFVQPNKGFVVNFCNNFADYNSLGSVTIEDLYAEGDKALLRAANKFDYREGVRFITYARFWIRNNISRYLENNKSNVKGSSSEISIEGSGSEENKYGIIRKLKHHGEGVEEIVFRREVLEHLEVSFERYEINPKAQQMLYMYFGIGEENTLKRDRTPYGEEFRTYQEIADELGSSRQCVEQTISKVLAKLGRSHKLRELYREMAA